MYTATPGSEESETVPGAVVKFTSVQIAPPRTLNDALLAAQKAFDHEDKDFFRACRKALQGEDIVFCREDIDQRTSCLKASFGEESMRCTTGAGSVEDWLRDFFMISPERELTPLEEAGVTQLARTSKTIGVKPAEVRLLTEEEAKTFFNRTP